MRTLLRNSLTVDIAKTKQLVIKSDRIYLTTSNWEALIFGIVFSAIDFNSQLNLLKTSSNIRDIKDPANSNRLFP